MANHLGVNMKQLRPFPGSKDTPPIPETLSPEGKDFLRRCFCRNPAERPSASMLLEHRFMRISHQPDVPSFLKPVGGIRVKEKS
ncbi:Mitogen-activated protein kinase kinase kinase 5 [Datura stramonium]|uniref:Mitogen-activated protein kinase kinase kinase 5 n=1 Tax=Datura stramonium TaxID=4076 RepID=A0ABS8SJQ2_DATST|nr:Mitogen-activated protein kinase kinase kinase 5 [Datura stramonium]